MIIGNYLEVGSRSEREGRLLVIWGDLKAGIQREKERGKSEVLSVVSDTKSNIQSCPCDLRIYAINVHEKQTTKGDNQVNYLR